MVKISDEGAKESFGIESAPALAMFKRGVPSVYTEDLFNDNLVLKWIKNELKQEEIKEVTTAVLEKLVERGKSIAVLFYDVDDPGEKSYFKELEKIDDDCARFEINFVKSQDQSKAKLYGITELPKLLYFENRIPSIYAGVDLKDEDALLQWLIEQKTTDTIEAVTDEMLALIVQDEPHVAVLFSGICHADETCAEIIEALERIDSKLSDSGIMLVYTQEKDTAKQNEVGHFPSLGLFKNNEFVLFEGDLTDEFLVLEWLSDRETLLVSEGVTEVNEKMLKHFTQMHKNVLVFLHRKANQQDDVTLLKLTHVEDNLDEKDVVFVRCSEKGIEKDTGLGFIPALALFKSQIPIIFPGELYNENDILSWAVEALEREEIEEVTESILNILVTEQDHIAVIFYDESEEDDQEFLQNMENLDDDCDNITIPIVKIKDDSLALQYGIRQTPMLLYFRHQVPGLYTGDDLKDYSSIMSWLTSQKKSENLQLVSDVILENVVDAFDYVCVFFAGSCKAANSDCLSQRERVTSMMEDISSDVENLGIVIVEDDEKHMAVKTLNVTEFPTIGLFRNGHFVRYPGGKFEHGPVLRWLSQTSTLAVPGIIEKVSRDMLTHIIESEDHVVVLFHDEHEKNLDDILIELETVDDNLEHEAVEFVRCADGDSLGDYGLKMSPSLVHFSNGVPTTYHADLTNDDAILGWISKELQEDKIPEVKEDVLDSLLDRLEFVTVVYYEPDNPLCKEIIQHLEPLADDAKLYDILFVTVSEDKVLDKLGISDFPVMVYYEDNIPFLYTGSLTEKTAVLQWLVTQRNTPTVEFVTDDMLEEIIEEHHFVAVLFTGIPNDEEGEELLVNIVAGLETIDGILDENGIALVMTSEMERARQMWISKYPTLVYFRNGDPVKFNGDLSQPKSVLKWLTSPKTINVPNKIISVNEMLLRKKLQRERSLFVFFYERGDVLAESVLRRLEDFEDQLAEINVDFVKISEPDVEEDFKLDSLPALVYFHGDDQETYLGDLRDIEALSEWIDAIKKAAKPRPSPPKTTASTVAISEAAAPPRDIAAAKESLEI